MAPGEPILLSLNLADASATADLFDAGAQANRDAACRRGSVDEIVPDGPSPKLIATGDLHDSPLHLRAVVAAAGLDHASHDPAFDPTRASHLTLHEIIHGDDLPGGVDMSHRALARVAALKAAHPELVHTLLANHELAQVLGSGIVKNGVKVVEAFNDGLERAYGDRAADVAAAIERFVYSMPLALRCHTPRGDILCAHSIPGSAVMPKFDAGVLSRELTPDDYTPRSGAAYLMIWGRGYDAEQIEDLVERWGVAMFILGHEHAENGAELRPPNVLVLNSDHERGVYLPIDLRDPAMGAAALSAVRRLR